MECTIVIPTKDRPAGLRLAVASALASAGPGAEVLVVDDGSAVPAESCLQGLNDPRLRVVRNEGNHGPAAARNLGVKEAQGELILFLDDDDALLQGYADKVKKAAATSESKFGFSATRENSEVSVKDLPDGPFPPGTPLSKKLAGLGMGFWIYRTVFLEVGGLDEDILVNEDTEFCLRLASFQVPGWYSRDPGVSLRPGHISAHNDLPSITSRTSPRRRAHAFQIMLTRYEGLLKQHPRLRWSFRFRVAKYLMRDRNIIGAARATLGAKAVENGFID